MNTKLNMYKNLIEENFENILSSKSKTLEESMMYSLKAGGKRLRPILLLEFFNAFKNDFQNAIPYAICVEMMHTYSLIHDDLPCMDNDDFRRGKLTNHKKFTEDIALLAGDSLLNSAFEIMSCEKYAKNFTSTHVLKAINMLASCAGKDGMIYGQILDTQNNVQTIEDLLEIHENKTGKLLKASCVCGAILGGASENEIEKVSDFAMNLGIAFQIKDDILDKYGSEEKLGKPLNSDEKLGKKTFNNFYSLKECESLVENYTNKAIDSIKDIKNTGFIQELAKNLVQREN